MLVINSQLSIDRNELEFTFARSSGPGGQNVNKVNSKAQLRWPVATSASLTDEQRARILSRYRHRITEAGELLVSSQRFRDQPRNIDDCLEKLQALLATALAPRKTRRLTKPTRASKARRLQAKRQLTEKKQSRRHSQRDE